ncbi:DUF4232 domain-containing protein [Streptomyces sp. Ag109_G2-15]|uniref:DUF4232 domain-containing protein n=1 Tax=Streptomyces sp. Ag109_G2-15 TaxID=1938850 RepID=UPI000BD72076|nr:DUF4232 domain-containing protein [Streptomyces sp. Ag109_G2-15]SOD80828.1 Protein of unknown function [Streptomyces sp. Ag109_G2-15]
MRTTRTTARPSGGLAVLMAVLMAGLALAACGTSTEADDTALGNCRTGSLKWTLVLLGKEKGGSRADARLTAVNKGPDSCVFDGYPGIEIHNGKAESIDGAGPGHPASFPLSAKAAVTVDLHYTPHGTKGADDWCVRQSEAVVRAPHDSDRTVVPVLDRHRRTAVIDACGETLSMAPPHRTPAGN